MIWLQFLGTALVIVLAGMRLARYGDVLGEKSGLGRSWIGLVFVAATTSLPNCSWVSARPRLPHCPILLWEMS